jgi:hypothetical protein
MPTRARPARPATSLLCLALACGDATDATDATTTTDTPTATTATPTDPTTSTTTTGTTGDEPAIDGELCTHLGGMEGVGKLVALFLGQLQIDDRINAYFLTSDVDYVRLGTCVAAQLGEAAECANVEYECMPMKDAHKDLRISMLDFLDFAADFGVAWDMHRAINAVPVTDADKTAVLDLLADMADDIVEDAPGTATVYQRVGRKPNIKTLIGDPGVPGSFVANVAADITISVFFDATDFERLNTCLVRQVQGIDGPATYGKERDDFPPGVDPGVSAKTPCLSMTDAHAALMDSTDGLGVQYIDFTALVDALDLAMTTAAVTQNDQALIIGALAPLCPMIVTVDPASCP